MDIILSSVGIIIAALVVVLLLVAIAVTRLIVHVPPNQVAVFTGRGTRPKTVVGSMRIRVPLLERVDRMSLEPFEVNVKVHGALSADGVPVNVDAVAVVRISSEEEALQTAIERYLTTDRQVLERQNHEILTGNLREVIATMSVEDLNTNREALTRGTASAAAASFGKLGMSLEVLTIQGISDDNGYLMALGRTRIAEVKRDADIGEAEAARETKVRSAEARREGEVAAAQADSAVSDAEKERDLRVAQNRGEVEAENARAAQQGLLADAEAKKAVGIAEEQAKAAREAAAVDVERQRAIRASEAEKANTIVPAQAAREAAAIRAEADRVTTVAKAEADAEATRSRGAAEATARTAVSTARQAELIAEAQGERARLEAVAAGELAMLLAKAEGERKLADAFNAFQGGAAQLYVLPQLIALLPEIAAKLAEPMGNIDRLVLIGNGADGTDDEGNGNSMVRQIAETVPMGLALLREVLKGTTGFDLMDITSGAIGSNGIASDGSSVDGGSGISDADSDEARSILE